MVALNAAVMFAIFMMRGAKLRCDLIVEGRTKHRAWEDQKSSIPREEPFLYSS